MTPPILGIWASQGRVNGSFESIATVTVGAGGASSISFSSIPSTYKHLQIRGIARATSSAGTTENWYCRFNGDSGANYSGHRLDGNGSTAYAQSYSSGTALSHYFPPNANTGANIFGAIVMDVLDYANTSKNKTVKLLSGDDYNGGGQVNFDSGAWYSTSAIDSMTFYLVSGSYAQYSSFALYGIR